MDGEVEAAVAAEAADLKGRRHVDEGTKSWEAPQGPPELLRDLLGRQGAGGTRGQLNGEPAGVLVPAAAAGVGHLRVDIGVLLDEVGDPLRVADHFVIRSPLRRSELNPQRVVVRIRDESLGDDAEHLDRRVQHAHEHREHRQAMPEDESQTPPVARAQAIERAVHEPCEPLLRVHDTQEAAAEHRRERDGNNAGNQDRRGNRDSEFAE